MTKDELRAELERQAERYKEVYGGEVTTYAAQPEPERKPWRKRATVQDQAFSQELEKWKRNCAASNLDLPAALPSRRGRSAPTRLILPKSRG